MAWWSRGRGEDAGRSRGERVSDPAQSLGHFRQFVASRRGVEAYVEPATRITSTTVVLIAHDGEWTRRAYPAKLAAELGPTLGIPVYDVNQTGYPARMRAWTSRQRRAGR
jgi:hypothetical protein